MTDIHLGTEGSHRFADFAARVGRGAAGVVRGTGRGLAAVTKQMQYSRMLRVLQEMSDADLEHIGITRADIPRHAAVLVDFEYDGL